jgi:hypothetical protein
VSGPSRRATRLVLPLITAGLFAAACGNAGSDQAGGSSPADTAGSAPAGSGAATSPTGPGGTTTDPGKPTGTAGPPSGIPAPSGVPVTPPVTSVPGGSPHQLGPADNGKTVTLKVGELLQIQLPSDKLAAGRWTLIGWPKDAVKPKLNNSGLGRFAFQAQATGSGRITFARFVCNTAVSSPCDGVPLPGPKFAPEPPGGKPAGWSVTVQVV